MRINKIFIYIIMAKRRMSVKRSKKVKKSPSVKKSSKSKTKKVNAFMKAKNAAMKKNAPSFSYKGKTYKRHQKGPLVYYKL